ncbi:MAG: hypothetical protein QOE22_692 [Candidatus Parcubacteria bacterium]|nr:hypothetical protein [Candidatus Parcubacteria bacterium]
MRTSFGPNPTASQKIELRSCENKALKACTKSAPKNATVLITAKSTCKFSCNAGYYLTKGGECKANGPAVSKNQKRIDELLKQIEKLTKELKKLQGK